LPKRFEPSLGDWRKSPEVNLQSIAPRRQPASPTRCSWRQRPDGAAPRGAGRTTHTRRCPVRRR
jgi:hypothetical protein